MRLNTKTTLFYVTLMVAMIVVLTAVSLFSFRQFSIISAQEHTRTAAEIIRVNLTEAMVNGVIDQRGNFLERLAQVNGLRSARVIRGPEVVQQFGEGLHAEAPQDAVEAQVLQSGEPYFAVVEEGMQPVFRHTIPFVADTRGTPNCLQCHNVPEGTVLGAVTLTMSMPHLKKNALLTIGGMLLTVGFFALLTLLFFRRMTRPLVTTAGEVQAAVERATDGDFEASVQRRTNDEIGQIADDFNKLTAFLHRGLTQIRDNVAQLLRCDKDSNGNLLTSTTGMVEGLIEVAHFKQAVEEDESKAEVFARLSRVLEEGFDLEHYSIYEVVQEKNRMTPVVVDGDYDSDCLWCDKQILVRAETCRARRTGHLIDAVESPHLCNAYCPDAEHSDWQHICLPVIQSGSVGSVVQLVVPPERAADVQNALPLIHAYLREAAPVVEAKRLMDTLRESNLRDPMTGLHNRRFLEEFVDTMVASSNRRKSTLCILMLDLDYFKKVNDTYGHHAGDTVLKEIARILVQSVRASDLVIRYGGEEFMVILQDTAGEHGDHVADKIRVAVETLKIQLPGTVLHKTISIGVADYPEDADTIWQTIKFADVALYQAKEQGRNRVVHFEPAMWEDASQY